MDDPDRFDLVVDGDRLTLCGPVAEPELAHLRQVVAQLVQDHRHATIDLRSTTLLPSAAVGILVRARRRARLGLGSLTLLASPDGHSSPILRVCGIDFVTPE